MTYATIYHKKTNNDIHISSYKSSLKVMSAIILVYVDTTDLDKDVKTEAVNVIIDQCNICCMSDHPRGINVSTVQVKGNSFYSSVVGLSFCQQTYSIDVNMTNVVMTNIASQLSTLNTSIQVQLIQFPFTIADLQA